MFFSGRDRETSQDRGKDERCKVQRDPWWKPAPEHSGTQTGAKVHLPTGQRPTVITQPRQRRSGFGTSLWMSLIGPARARTWTWSNICWDLKISVQRCSPSNLTELERIRKEELEKLPKYRCAKLVASYPIRIKVVIAAKGASTKCWVKGLNTC